MITLRNGKPWIAVAVLASAACHPVEGTSDAGLTRADAAAGAGGGIGDAGDPTPPTSDDCAASQTPTLLLADVDDGIGLNALDLVRGDPYGKLAIVGDRIVLIDSNNGEDAYASTSAIRVLALDGSSDEVLYEPGPDAWLRGMRVHNGVVYFLQGVLNSYGELEKHLHRVPLEGGAGERISTAEDGFDGRLGAIGDDVAYILEPTNFGERVIAVSLADGSASVVASLDDSVDGFAATDDSLWLTVYFGNPRGTDLFTFGATTPTLERVSSHACRITSPVITEDGYFCGADRGIDFIDFETDTRVQWIALLDYYSNVYPSQIAGPDGQFLYSFPYYNPQLRPLLRIRTDERSAEVIACVQAIKAFASGERDLVWIAEDEEHHNALYRLPKP